MAAEKVRVINIHRTPKYENKQFIQLDYDNIGVVFGKLTKVGAKNLYIYFMSNKDNYASKLIAADYANWLGCSYSKDGVVFDQTARAKINKQIREGLDQLIAEGYVVEKVEDQFFEFYEYGTNSSTENEKLYEEQKVSQETESSTSDEKLPEKPKVTSYKEIRDKKLLEKQKVTQVTESSTDFDAEWWNN